MLDSKSTESQPLPPTFNQVFEDLREAESQGSSLPSPSEVLSVSKETDSDAENLMANKHYETIKKLVDDSSNLEDVLQQLKKVNSTLKNQFEELKDMTNSVKKLGASALK